MVFNSSSNTSKFFLLLFIFSGHLSCWQNPSPSSNLSVNSIQSVTPKKNPFKTCKTSDQKVPFDMLTKIQKKSKKRFSEDLPAETVQMYDMCSINISPPKQICRDFAMPAHLKYDNSHIKLQKPSLVSLKDSDELQKKHLVSFTAPPQINPCMIVDFFLQPYGFILFYFQ